MTADTPPADPRSIADRVRAFHVPLGAGEITLREARAALARLGASQDDIPYLVQLVENPRFDLPGLTIFNGATDLATHDQIHLLLGRGLLSHDEAFVIGFTMGSSNRVGNMEERLFSLIAKYLYPKHYRFSDADIHVYQDAVRLGFVSDCKPLASVDFEPLQELPLREARARIGIEEDLLRAYYRIEAKRYPTALESQRLLVAAAA